VERDGDERGYQNSRASHSGQKISTSGGSSVSTSRWK
jgi:hypothetical protein